MKKKVYKRFNIYNFDIIEAFLQNQHKQGWKLVNIKPFGIFCFEKCEPEDVAYCLDKDTFSVLDDKNPYLQQFADDGWEFIQMFRNFNFFRKKKENFASDVKRPVDCQKYVSELVKNCKKRITAMIVSGIWLIRVWLEWFNGEKYLYVFLLSLLILGCTVTVYKDFKSCKRLESKYLNM